MKKVLICSCIVAVCLTFIVITNPFAEEKGTQISTTGGVVLGHLKMRDKVVTISKGEKGTVYTVKNSEGKLLDENLNEKSFQAKYPSLYDRLQDGRAGGNDLWRQKQLRR